MSNTLITFPGKLGDCIWAAATMKEIAGKEVDGQIDIALSVFCRPLVDVFWCQPWVEDVYVLEDWRIFPGAPAPSQPVVPPTIPEGYDKVVHLGLPDWPQLPLGVEFGRITHLVPSGDPWLTPPQANLNRCGRSSTQSNVIAFTDEHVELKVGLISSIYQHAEHYPILLVQPNSRLATEFFLPPSMLKVAVDLKHLTAWIGSAPALITDKSMARVLAYAMGIPTYVVEPAEARWNNIFDPPAGWRKDAGMLNGSNAKEMIQMIEGEVKRG